VIKTPKRELRASRGWTLLELLVCMAVVVVLVAVAVPLYRQFMLRSHRTEAVGALLGAQLSQERFFLAHGRYAAGDEELAMPAPSGLGFAGSASLPEGFYRLQLSGDGPNRYLLMAEAAGAQTADRPECLRYSINEQGLRAPAPDSGCWR
jgi:type IV pilus assembly protein PilE